MNIQPLIKFISQHRIVSLVIYFGLFLACLIGFVEVAEEVHEGEIQRIDEAILQAINGYSSSFWDRFFVIITQFGGVLGIITLAAGLLLLLIRRKHYKKALIVGVSVGGAALLNLALKFIFERSRPDLWEQLIVEHSFSFPSGHAMISAALALSVIFIFWKTRYRWVTLVGGSLFIILIGFSRLYLGVHYPTDILAGWLVSSAWLLVVILIIHSKHLYVSLKQRNG
jgi:membrane-associated phospholipid phosphatase